MKTYWRKPEESVDESKRISQVICWRISQRQRISWRQRIVALVAWHLASQLGGFPCGRVATAQQCSHSLDYLKGTTQYSVTHDTSWSPCLVNPLFDVVLLMKNIPTDFHESADPRGKSFWSSSQPHAEFRGLLQNLPKNFTKNLSKNFGCPSYCFFNFCRT